MTAGLVMKEFTCTSINPVVQLSSLSVFVDDVGTFGSVCLFWFGSVGVILGGRV